MRNSRNPRGTCLAPGSTPASVSCFSRTSTMAGLGDCRDSSCGVTSGTCDRAFLSNSDFVFMVGILADIAARHAPLVPHPMAAHPVFHRRGDAREAAGFHPAARGAIDARAPRGRSVHVRHPDGARARAPARELRYVQAGVAALEYALPRPSPGTEPEPGLLRPAVSGTEAALGVARPAA